MSSLEELVDLGLDCAFVLTPKAAHMEQIKFLIEHGVHTFSEKLMATTMCDCAEIVELSEKTDKKIMIGFNRRYAPVITAAKEAWKGSMPDVIIAQKNRPQTEYHAIADRSAGQWEESIEMHGQNQTVFVKMPESVTVVDNEKRHTKDRNNKTPLTDPHDAYKTHELLNRVLHSAGLPAMD